MDRDEHILGSCEVPRKREKMVNSEGGNVKCEVYKDHSNKQLCTNYNIVHVDCTVHNEGLQHDCDQCHRTEAHEDTSLLSSLEKTEETLLAERPTSIKSKEELVPDGGWGWVIVFGASLILVSVNQISEFGKFLK